MFFIFAEIGVRFFAPETQRKYQFDENLGAVGIPDITFKYQTKEFGALTHRTNSLGFVDSEYKLEKDKNVYRIVFLGDSWLAALQVPREKTFCKVLENKLNKLYPDKKFEVINLGLDGIATGKEYLFLREIGLKYNPDLVILMFYAENDVEYNSLEISEDKTEPYFDLVDGSLKQVKYPEPYFKNKLISFINKYFWSPRFFYQKLELVKSRINEFRNKSAGESNKSFPQHLNVYKKDYDLKWERAWEIAEALINKMKATAKEKGANFVLVSLPYRFEVNPLLWNEILDEYPVMKNTEWDLEKPSRILRDFSRKSGIDYLGLLPTFREFISKTGEEIYGDHFNSKGHELTAELIYNFLIENNLIDI